MILVVILVILAVIVLANVRTVHQGHVQIVERLGKFHDAWGAGLHVKVPFIDAVRKDVSLKEQTYDFPESQMITKDNIVIVVDSVVYSKVFDAQKYYYGIEDPVFGIENLTTTTLRSIVGSKNFDELLNGRDAINAQLKQEIDSATDPWGISITRVEVKKLQASREVQETMQKEMTAERNKRATILDAEAHQKSIITAAEGDKKAAILAAEAQAESTIKKAEADAEAIRKVAEARAYEAQIMADAIGSSSYVTIKGYDALKEVADGNATKIYVPADLASNIVRAGVEGDSFVEGFKSPAAKKHVEKPRIDHCETKNAAHKEDAAQIGDMIDSKSGFTATSKKSDKKNGELTDAIVEALGLN